MGGYLVLGAKLRAVLSGWLYVGAAASATLVLVAAPAQQAPVFKGGIDLLKLDVTVVDKNGAPVTGLAASDFAVRIDGQARQVRTLDYLRFGPDADAPQSTSSNRQAPAGPQASRGGRVIVLLFDDLSAKPGEIKGLVVAAERTLSGLGADDLVGVATTSALGPVVSPTRDRSIVAAAFHNKLMVGRNDDSAVPFFITVKEALDINDRIRNAGGGPIRRECEESPLGPSCSDMVIAAAGRLAALTRRRSGEQLEAYRNVIDALRPAPKPRVVIALSKGVAATAGRTLAEAFDPISRAAAEADVQFYGLTEAADTIDIQAVGRPVRDALNPFADRVSAQRVAANYLADGVASIAVAAGGDAFQVVGQADRFFKRIFSEASGLYALGVEIPAPPPGQRFFEVKVSVRRPNVTVRARRQVLAPGLAAAEVPVEDALQMRLSQGGVAFGVPISLATALRRGASGDLQLGVEAQIPVGVPGPLIAMFAIVDAQGAVVRSGRREIAASPTTDDYRISFAETLTAGTYRLRFAVADAGGNVGSVQRSVEAVLHRFGAVQTSDLLATWANASGANRFLALDLVPANATTLRAAIELYADDPQTASSLRVRFRLLGGEASTPVAVLDATPTLVGGALTASATLSAAALAAGDYTIQVDILNAGALLGTVSTPIRKGS